MAEIKGIDVSKHQGKIDWTKVKAAGVQFAMLRAGYGRYDQQKDERFEEYYAGATAVGIPVGAYHYSYAMNAEQAKQEAQTFLGWIDGKQFAYPVAFDIEDAKQSGLSTAVISDIIRAFCDTVKAAGYYVVVYANKSWLDTKIDADCKAKYDIWLAQWTSKPTFTGKYGMWQYTSAGTVDGIGGRVDMDMAYKDYPTLIQAGGYNGYKAEAPNHAVSAQPANDHIDVEYQTYTGKYWLGWVENYNEKNADGYAGITGKAVNAIRAGLSKGKIKYRVHTKGGKWYPWVTNYNTKNTDGYAGVLGKEIDMLQMTLVDLPGYAVEYRVSTVGGGYLPWVRNYNTTNPNGYAGITGKPIDRVQIRVVKA